MLNKTVKILRNEGIQGFFYRLYVSIDKYIHKKKYYHFSNLPNKTKKILFVSGEPINSTSHYRCEIPCEALNSKGWESQIIHIDFMKQEFIDKFEYIVWYRVPFTKDIGRFTDIIKKRNKPIIFSIDDLIFDDESLKEQVWLNQLNQKGKEEMFLNSKGYRDFLKITDLVIVSTDFLKEQIGRFTNGEVITVGNSYSNFELTYANSINKQRERYTAGFFSGSLTHGDNLALITKDLVRLFKAKKEFRMIIAGRVELPKELLEFKDRIELFPFTRKVGEYLSIISRCSIVLSPLVENKHNYAKSEIRGIQAALVKRAILASNVPIYSEMLLKQFSEFIVKDNNWYDRIVELIESTDLDAKSVKFSKSIINNYNPIRKIEPLIDFITNYENK